MDHLSGLVFRRPQATLTADLWSIFAPPFSYDVWADPFTRESVNDLYPEQVEHYTALLEAQWEAHQALARQFTPGEASPLTPEQLRTLRSLGYIR